MQTSRAELTIGATPWLPSDDAEAVAEFDRFNVPTTGLFRQGGTHFLFDCLEGHTMRGNVWLYAPVSDEEAERLQCLDGDELFALIDEIFPSRSIMGALAIDEKIRSGTLVDLDDITSKGLNQALIDELKDGRGVAADASQALQHLVDA